MIIVITGPTCTHKSAIAVKVALALNAEIINADAFQIYQELEIGTAKPTIDALKKVKHHLYSFLKPNTPYSIYQYQKDARAKINALLKQKKNVVLVGGSGLYIRSVLYDYDFKEADVKIDLSRYEKLDNQALHDVLKKIDPKSAKQIHYNNRRRVLRALYIYEAYHERKSDLEAEQSHQIIYPDVHIYATNMDKKELYKRIDDRTLKMVNSGLIKEAMSLKEKYGEGLQALKAIGYREIVENPDLSATAITEMIQADTRHYAKRQITFIKYQYGDAVKWINDANEIIHDFKKPDMDERTAALIGKDNLKKLKKIKVAIVGVGGVGGTAAEALVRSGISNLTLIDDDVVNATNLNRQVLFTNEDIAKKKVKVAKKKLEAINPNAKIKINSSFVTPDNLKDYDLDKFDYVIDAIDSTQSKISLLTYLLEHQIKFISSLGMGNRLDPSKLTITTLDKTRDDPLAKKIRSELKKKGVDLKQIPVVTSNEIPLKNKPEITSMIFVPSAAGLLLANYVINKIIKGE